MNRSTLSKLAIGTFALATVLSCGKDDGPEETVNTAPRISAQSFNASEAVTDSDILGKVVASDAEGDALRFSLKTDSNGVFEISDNGDISLVTGKALDFETAQSHSLSVDVSDTEFTSNAAVTINVIDIDENLAPVFAAQTFTVDENVAFGTTIGVLAATDPDGDALTYSWPANSNVTVFVLDDNKIKTSSANMQGALNFEETATYTVPVIVSDGMLSTQADITVNVRDVNDKPVIGADVFSAQEDIADTAIIGNLSVTDEDGTDFSYTVTVDTDNLFRVDSNGDIRVRAGRNLDFETDTTHSFRVLVRDDSGATDQADVTVNVIDVNETVVASRITVSTIAGSNVGFQDGTGTAARFRFPFGIELQGNGNLFVVDNGNNSIRLVTAAGAVSSWSGRGPNSISAGGAPDLASGFDIVSTPNGLNFVSDISNHVIYQMQPRVRGADVLVVFAGSKGIQGAVNGTGSSARFAGPRGLAADSNGNLYVADQGNHMIRKITPSGVVTTFAGSGSSGFADGNGSSARFNNPTYLVVDSNDNVLVTDSSNHRIRKITPSGDVTTLAGDGTSAIIDTPLGIAVDDNDNIYFVEGGSHSVRKLDANLNISTIAGTGSAGAQNGDATVAEFNDPSGIAVNGSGTILYVTDGNHRIRKITISQALD